MDYFPQDLIEELLSHLPVKSLLRLKCVSKSWHSLISDPYFVDLHFQRSSQRTHLVFHTLASENRSIDLNAPLHNDSAVVRLRSLFPQNVEIVGSCRGFLCLFLYNVYFYIWNPSTDTSKQVSPPPLWLNSCLYGFGYDASTDDYLIVVASWHPYQVPRRVAQLEIFSVRTNAWTKLEVVNVRSFFPIYDPDYVTGSFLNGAIHWSVVRAEIPEVSEGAIIAFDLRERSLREIAMPYELRNGYGELKVLGGCLSLIWRNSIICGKIEIWMMREYGVKSSWTRHITMSLSEFPGKNFSPICYTKDGQIVGIDGDSGLAICNDKGELLEHRQYSEDLKHFAAKACVYIESLLSFPC